MRATEDRPTRVVHLGVDVASSPIWENGENRPANEYPLTASLIEELSKWAAAYNELVDAWDPIIDTSSSSARAHDEHGERLWSRLVTELGTEFEIHYDSPIRGESVLVHKPPT